jgi:DNA-binding protein HU-beta
MEEGAGENVQTAHMIPVSPCDNQSPVLEFGLGAIHAVQDSQLRPFDCELMGCPRVRMTQSQVMEHLVKTIGISKKDAKLTLDELNTLVVRELKKEGSIRLAGLGILRKRKLAARVGRNPATGDQIKIPARTRLRFTPAKALKESVLGVAAPAAKKKAVSKATPGAAKAARKK